MNDKEVDCKVCSCNNTKSLKLQAREIKIRWEEYFSV